MGSRGKSLSASLKRTMKRAHKSLHQTSSDNTSDESYREALFNELRENNVKFSEQDTLFITRDQYGEITWLENGNELAGLRHIQHKHASQFEQALGIKGAEIPSHIKEVIEKGTITYSTPDKGGTRREYLYKGRYLCCDNNRK